VESARGEGAPTPEVPKDRRIRCDVIAGLRRKNRRPISAVAPLTHPRAEKARHDLGEDNLGLACRCFSFLVSIAVPSLGLCGRDGLWHMEGQCGRKEQAKQMSRNLLKLRQDKGEGVGIGVGDDVWN